MNTIQLYRILRARIFLIVMILTVTVVTTAIITTIMPKSYTAETALVVDYRGNDPFNSVVPAQNTSSYMATQIDILASQRVALRVIDNLKLDDDLTAKGQYLEETGGEGSIRDWLSELLLENLDVKPSRDSRIVLVSFTSADPNFSKTIANAFASAYMEINLELSLEPAKQSTAWFNNQLKILRERLEEAQSNLTTYQQKYGIVATDERLDTELARLTALSNQLVEAQAQTVDAESRLAQTERLLKSRSLSTETIPEVIKNGFIQSLKSEILKQQAKLADLSAQYGKNHPQYERLVAEIKSLRGKLHGEIKNITEGIKNTARLVRANEGTLERSVADQKATVLALKRQRDDLSVLQRERENARRTYEAAMQRFNEINMQSQFNQTNISVLTEAISPINPSRPNVVLNMALAIILGSILAVLFALLFEFRDRRIRSDNDVTELLGIPVLGELRSASVKKQKSPEKIRSLGRIKGKVRRIGSSASKGSGVKAANVNVAYSKVGE